MSEHRTITYDSIAFSIESIKECHRKQFTDFSVSKESEDKNFNTYISSGEAYADALSGNGVTHIVTNTKCDDELVGYYTLANVSIPYRNPLDIEEGEDILYGINAVEIKMFAISEKYQDVFLDSKPIAAWIFEMIISSIDDMSLYTSGVQCVFLHSVEKAEKFYEDNHMVSAHELMNPFYSIDGDCKMYYMFIRDVHIPEFFNT